MNEIRIMLTIAYCHQLQASPKGKSPLQEPCQKSAVDIRLTTGIARISRMLNTRRMFLMIRNLRLMRYPTARPRVRCRFAGTRKWFPLDSA